MPLDVAMKTHSKVTSVEEWLQTLTEARLLAADQVKEAQRRQKEQYDKKRLEVPFRVGDRVLLLSPVVEEGKSKKFTHPWQGPFRIVRALGNLAFELVHVENPANIQKAHAIRLKHYFETFTEDDAVGTSQGGSAAADGDQSLKKEIEKEREGKGREVEKEEDSGKGKEVEREENNNKDSKESEKGEKIKNDRKRNRTKRNKRKIEKEEDWEIQIESILDHRDTSRGREYLVKYNGFTKRHNAWVKEGDLDAPDLLAAYQKRLLWKPTSRGRLPNAKAQPRRLKVDPSVRRSTRERKPSRRAQGLD